MAWQALEDIASAHKLPHPWNRQHERSLTGATAQPQAGSAPGHPAAIPARARARLDGRERQRGRQAVDRAARAAGRALGELLGGLGRQLLALRLRLHAQPARALLAQHAQPDHVVAVDELLLRLVEVDAVGRLRVRGRVRVGQCWPEPSVPSTPRSITTSPSMHSSSDWLKFMRLAACARG